jgi:hypothetical protein
MAVLAVACSSPAQQEPVAHTCTLPDTIEYHKHIAPVVAMHCAPCHNEGGAAPFALSASDDLRRRSKTIAWVLSDAIMPPWPADTTYSRFKDEKILPACHRAMLLAWIEQGCPEGEPSATLPAVQTTTASALPEPDLVLSFPEALHIPGNNRDHFWLVKLPFELPADTFVKAIYFEPGNRQAVHHVNGHLINYEFHKKTSLQNGSWHEDAETFSSSIAYRLMDIPHDDGSYPSLLASAFNYLPGVEPLLYPEGIGGVRMMRKGAIILNTLHYGPADRDTIDRSRVLVYFAKAAPKRPARELHLGTLGVSPVEPEFVIPAGEVVRFTTRYTLPETISVLTVNPHMHLLGKSFRAYATSPDRRDTIPLIHLPRWDFRWQYFYTFRQMLKIPAGYEITAEATFDNTMQNPHNPYSPPRTIRSTGDHMKTTDEMFQFFVTWIPYRPGDEHIKL